MAVTFNEKSFTIEVETATSPIEYWLETQGQLIDLLQSEDSVMHGNKYHFLELLRSMQPSIELASRMLKPEK